MYARQKASRFTKTKTQRWILSISLLIGSVCLNPIVKASPALLEQFPSVGPLAPEIAFVDRNGGLAESLVGMLEHDLVAIGKVVGILREAHSPYNSMAGLQHTVFHIQLETVVKDNYNLSTRSIKVRQEMGKLPWKQGENVGVGSYIVGEPLLKVGSRYILFLTRVADPKKQKYLMAEYGGVKGPMGDADELSIPAGEYGQILIEKGRLVFPQVPWEKPRANWKFQEGPQILGLTEREGLIAIFVALKKRQSIDAARAEKRRKLGESELERLRTEKEQGGKKPPQGPPPIPPHVR